MLSLLGTASVGGGYANQATGMASTFPGGIFNTASGDLSFAAGAGAQALHPGSFVWADNSSFYNYFSSPPINFSYAPRVRGDWNKPAAAQRIVATEGSPSPALRARIILGHKGCSLKKSGTALIFGYN